MKDYLNSLCSKTIRCRMRYAICSCKEFMAYAQRKKFNCFTFLLPALFAPLLAEPLPPNHVDDFVGHPRVIIISDIGNEPDDQCRSFVSCCIRTKSISKR